MKSLIILKKNIMMFRIIEGISPEKLIIVVQKILTKYVNILDQPTNIQSLGGFFCMLQYRIQFGQLSNILEPTQKCNRYNEPINKKVYLEANMKRDIKIIMHTHWDREWYFTKDETKVLLRNHMEEVMTYLEKHPDAIYILDGQSVMIDDYLELEPKAEERLRNLVGKGSLRVGPWYTQTDLLLVHGESIYRNLYYGIKRASEFGEPMKVGYAPDTFGHASQMPQIYDQFGIGSSFFWRQKKKKKKKKKNHLGGNVHLKKKKKTKKQTRQKTLTPQNITKKKKQRRR
eukprot:TRINITY_DN3111_c0_g1_i1.p2 TRINITY_DN3111_c0_g1~~TRINITY_DN3111_c0_g1_i1.p2  ORF type:complete len:287 (-),score=39.42 TRINITY_DN3111_c0_g1_i1:58-918(-)